MGELQTLPNICARQEQQLREAGIDTIALLKETGSQAAWLCILEHDPSACLSRLCSLEGAIHGVWWHSFDAKVKAQLRHFISQHRQTGTQPGVRHPSSVAHRKTGSVPAFCTTGCIQ